jgi:DNA polymerase-1
MSNPKKKRLVVIDGKSVFYRGYYAMPYLSTKDGTPTGGVYGFAVMALEVLKKMEPDYICVAWDKPKTNIRRRREIYPEYKANRKPAPADFYEQVPILHQLLEAFNIPLYEIDDHEADDIMATFAKQAHKKGYESILVTSDHDVFQLVDDHTVVAALRKGLTNVDYYDQERFAAKYKMTPEQFIDYKALRGDPSDNLPGVAGVGEKTATQLIADYQTLDGVYENLDGIKGTLQSKLRDNKDLAYITKELVILDKDVDLKLDWEKADVSKNDSAKIVQILRDLEFKSLLSQLPDEWKLSAKEVAAVNSFVPEAKPIPINSKKDLEKINTTAKEVVMYSYTAGAVNTDMKVLLISTSPKEVYVINLEKIKPSDVKPVVAKLLKSAQLISFDSKAGTKSLIQAGMDEPTVKHDVHMASFLINSLNHSTSLSEMAMTQLGFEGESFDSISPEDVILRADMIASLIWALYAAQKEELKTLNEIDKLAKAMEWPLVNVLARMEIAGVKLDTKFMAEMSERLGDQIVDVEQEIYGHADKEFNISSPGQLAEVLFEDLGLPTAGIKKGFVGSLGECIV